MMPIHFAAERGHQDVIEYLVRQMQARIPHMTREQAFNITDTHGSSPLHYAAMKKNQTLMEWLKKQGSDETLRNADNQTASQVLSLRPSVLYTLDTPNSNSQGDSLTNYCTLL
mmetsp:Transcript_9575/g.11836  ORF Transcript_9575/g.11836 Transcript_9575/m.11836 type:complete len:113 (-) Transcript_9575:34-372(-)